jgi:hypothetical protein
MNTIVNAIVKNAVLALALSVRQALDYANRHFGKQVVTGYMKDGGTVTVPEGASDQEKKDFNSKHLPSLKLASALAKSGNVTFNAFCAELEKVRIAEIERVKAEQAAADAMKKGAKKTAPATSDATPDTMKKAA